MILGMQPLGKPAFAAACEAVELALGETPAPGVALGVVSGDDEHTATFGITSVESPVRVTAETIFQIGSITKTFTATAAMRLVDEGRLDLDEPLRTYLPDLRLEDEATAARVTMRHLLTHTAGWVGDHFRDYGRGDDALARMSADLEELPQLTPVGEVWSYNNAAFYLAGHVIEVITGPPYELAVRELLLEPLGLEHTFFFAEDVLTHRFAVGHVDGDDGPPSVARPWSIGRAHHPAGGLASSVADMLRYARFHLSDADGILSSASRELMRSPAVEIRSMHDAMGLAWGISRRGDRTVMSHSGATWGQEALLFLVPDEALAVVVLTNHQRGGRIAGAVRRAALGSVGITDPERIAIGLPARELEEYAGTYTCSLYDVDLTIADGGLMLAYRHKTAVPKDPPPRRIAFYAPDRLFIAEGPAKGLEADFLRDPDGGIAWFRIGGRLTRPGARAAS